MSKLSWLPTFLVLLSAGTACFEVVVILAFFDGVQFDFNLFPSILVLTSSSSSPS